MKLFVPIVVLISLWFYWFQWRPSQARSFCNWNVRWGEYKDTPKDAEAYQTLFVSCMRSRGIEK